MALILTDVDSPILKDAQSSFIGGQFSNAAPIQLEADTCALLEDAEESTTGQAASRRGTIQLGSPFGVGSISVLDYYKSSTADYAMAGTSSGGVYKFVAGDWVLVSSGSPPAGAITMAVGNGFLYAATGSGTIRKYNGTTWVALSTDSPPSDCSILLWDGFRLIASGQSTAPDSIYFSGILHDDQWATLSGGYQIQPGGGDGLPIVAVKAWTGSNLAVFKRGSTWLVGADPKLDVSNFPIQRVHKRLGCIAVNSAHQCGDDILFLANDLTVRSLEQTIASNDQWELGLPISFPIQDVLQRVNPAAASGAAGFFWKGRYFLALPLDSSSTNNYIVVYNTVTRKWSGGWTNLPVGYFASRTDSGVEKLIMGLHNDRRVIELLDYVEEADATDATYTDYNGVTVPYRFITRAFMFGDLDSKKKGLNMTMKLNKNRGRVLVTAIFDEGALRVTKSIDTGTPTSLLFPITFPAFFGRSGIQPASMSLRPYPRFHQVQFEVKADSPGRKEIRALTVQAFPEAVDLRASFIAREPDFGLGGLLLPEDARITTSGDTRITTSGDTRITASGTTTI